MPSNHSPMSAAQVSSIIHRQDLSAATAENAYLVWDHPSWSFNPHEYKINGAFFSHKIWMPFINIPFPFAKILSLLFAGKLLVGRRIVPFWLITWQYAEIEAKIYTIVATNTCHIEPYLKRIAVKKVCVRILQQKRKRERKRSWCLSCILEVGRCWHLKIEEDDIRVRPWTLCCFLLNKMQPLKRALFSVLWSFFLLCLIFLL